ncbi:MAG: carbohydrate kinase [Bacteroidaceae bacterium]|nr:carbohydrate kinase [Bacteroidaceae bacterium]
MKKYIIGMGEALWDVLPDGKKIGGAPANFAYHVSQQGLNGCAISAIGKDTLGDEIIEAFDSKHLSYHLERVDCPTGTVEVTLDSNGIPQYDIKENAAWDCIPWTKELAAIAAQTQAICFGSLAQRSATSHRTIHQFLAAMPQSFTDEESGLTQPTLKVFDINLRQTFYTKEVIEESMHMSNILKINDEELVIVSRLLGLHTDELENLILHLPEHGTGNLTPQQTEAIAPICNLCRQMQSRYSLQMIILTCGTHGSYVITDKEVSFLPTPKVQVADTVGAGDSFTGSFISSLIKGKSIGEAHRKAVEVSAYVCTQNGAMPELPQSLK